MRPSFDLTVRWRTLPPVRELIALLDPSVRAVLGEVGL